MRAILLAAGYGSRLRPFTNSLPKCLVPINGKPLLYYWLEQLYAVGVSDFLVNTHYLAPQVEEAVKSHPLASMVTLFHEESLLGTAGTVKAMLQSTGAYESDTLILHADNFCVCSWKNFFQFHQKRSSEVDVSMMGFVTDTPENCGIMELDVKNRLIAFHEKVPNPPGNLASAATYLFSPKSLAFFDSLTDFETDISYDLVPKLLGKAQVWKTDGFLKDIGILESYRIVNENYQQIMDDYKYLIS